MQNETEHVFVSIDQSDLDELKREIRKTKANFGGIVFLLFLIVIGLAYLSISVYRKTHSNKIFDSTSSVLIVRIKSEESDDSDCSDARQVENAITSGGMIQLKLSGDFLKEAMGSDLYGNYGAANSKGYYYILGAVLNYVASRGWTLIQGPSSGLANVYYFIQ